MDKFCTNCGSKLEPNQVKCYCCGKVLNNTHTFNNTNNHTSTYENEYNKVEPSSNEKSNISIRLLGFFSSLSMGFMGMHNFIYGRTAAGLIELGISLCSVGTLIPFVWLFSVIEGFLMLCGVIKPQYTFSRQKK